MLRINDDTLLAQRRQLEANLSAAQTQYHKAISASDMKSTQLDIGVNQASQNVIQSNINSEQVKLTMQQAKTDLARVKNLYDRGAVAKQDLENARLRYNTAEKQYAASQSLLKNAKESLELAKSNTGQNEISRQDIDAASAQIEALSASIAMLDINIRDCEVRAPFSGTISYKDKSISKGSMVSASPLSPIFKLVDNNNLYMQGVLPETFVAKVKKGDAAEIKIDAYPAKVFAGIVDRIIPAVDPKSLSFSVRISLDNSSSELSYGMFAKADIAVGEVSGVVIPAYAIIKNPDVLAPPEEYASGNEKAAASEEDGGYSIFIERNGKAVRKDVIVLGFNEKEYIVAGKPEDKSAISDKDRVIVTSVKSLQESESVKIVNKNQQENAKKSDDNENSKSEHKKPNK